MSARVCKVSIVGCFGAGKLGLRGHRHKANGSSRNRWEEAEIAGEEREGSGTIGKQRSEAVVQLPRYRDRMLTPVQMQLEALGVPTDPHHAVQVHQVALVATKQA